MKTILIIAFILVLYLTISSFINTYSFLVVCYENEENENTNNLIKLFEKNNYNYKIVGYGEKWNGWYGRSIAYYNFLNTLPKNTYILLCDGRDVLVNEKYNKFIKKALKIRYFNGDKIIVGTEEGCCTTSLNNVYKAKNIISDDFIGEYMEQQKQNSINKGINNKLYYINFGLLFGTAGQLVTLFNKLNIQPEDDDQALLHKLYYEEPDLLFLDHNHELFSNASHLSNKDYENSRVEITSDEDICYYTFVNGRFKNTRTGTYPSIIQTPAKNWDCYNYLLKKLL